MNATEMEKRLVRMLWARARGMNFSRGQPNVAFASEAALLEALGYEADDNTVSRLWGAIGDIDMTWISQYIGSGFLRAWLARASMLPCGRITFTLGPIFQPGWWRDAPAEAKERAREMLVNGYGVEGVSG